MTPSRRQQRRRVSAARDRVRAVVADLGQQRGHEVLVAEVGAHPPVDLHGDVSRSSRSPAAARNSPRTIVAVRTAPRPLPRTSPMSSRTAPGRDSDLVQVTADQRLAGGTHIAGRQAYRTDLGGGGARMARCAASATRITLASRPDCSRNVSAVSRASAARRATSSIKSGRRCCSAGPTRRRSG